MEFVEEPLVYLGKLMDAVNGISALHRLRDYEYAFISRSRESLVNVGYIHEFVFNKSVHALSYHAETLLDDFLKSTSDGHHLSYRLHG